jgi:hypothetical protein
MAKKTFKDGYTDGWHSEKPGTDPEIPAHAIPAGKTDYEHGYELGRAAALGIEPNSN